MCWDSSANYLTGTVGFLGTLLPRSIEDCKRYLIIQIFRCYSMTKWTTKCSDEQMGIPLACSQLWCHSEASEKLSNHFFPPSLPLSLPSSLPFFLLSSPSFSVLLHFPSSSFPPPLSPSFPSFLPLPFFLQPITFKTYVLDFTSQMYRL